MFGFVKPGKEIRSLGGEVIRLKKRRIKFFLFLTMVLGFLLVNIVLYMVTVM
jgi:hypothetical protein